MGYANVQVASKMGDFRRGRDYNAYCTGNLRDKDNIHANIWKNVSYLSSFFKVMRHIFGHRDFRNAGNSKIRLTRLFDVFPLPLYIRKKFNIIFLLS